MSRAKVDATLEELGFAVAAVEDALTRCALVQTRLRLQWQRTPVDFTSEQMAYATQLLDRLKMIRWRVASTEPRGDNDGPHG